MINEDSYRMYFQPDSYKEEGIPLIDKEGDSTISTIIRKNEINYANLDLYQGSINNRRLKADGFVNTVDEACDVIRRLLNVVLGQDWGEFVHGSSDSIDLKDIKLPSIRYSTNLREVSENHSPKPKKLETQKELNNGVPSGDGFDIYKQHYDTIVEFNIRDKDSKSCSDIAEKFEEVMSLYSSVLKKEGISEVFFLKEVPAKYSTTFTEHIPTVTLYYYIKLERTYVVKHSSLAQIEIEMRNVKNNFTT